MMVTDSRDSKETVRSLVSEGESGEFEERVEFMDTCSGKKPATRRDW